MARTTTLPEETEAAQPYAVFHIPQCVSVDSCTGLHHRLHLQLWLNVLTWLGLIEGPKHKSRHISMRLCATWLDCTRTTESYAAIHAWNMTRCWYTPAASRRGAAWERKRERDGRLHCCTARNVIGCSCLFTFVQSEQLLIGEYLRIVNWLESYKRKLNYIKINNYKEKKN